MDSAHLDRIADDQYKDRRINVATFCGTCGYNLQSLPYVHHCPECGHAYNARPLKLENIFVPQHVDFPLGDLVSGILFLAIGVPFLVLSAAFEALKKFVHGEPTDGVVQSGPMMIALFLVPMGVIFGVRAGRGIARFARAVSILRRIRADEEHDEDEDDWIHVG